jgi:hypothetical protein
MNSPPMPTSPTSFPKWAPVIVMVVPGDPPWGEKPLEVMVCDTAVERRVRMRVKWRAMRGSKNCMRPPINEAVVARVVTVTTRQWYLVPKTGAFLFQNRNGIEIGKGGRMAEPFGSADGIARSPISPFLWVMWVCSPGRTVVHLLMDTLYHYSFESSPLGVPGDSMNNE